MSEIEALWSFGGVYKRNVGVIFIGVINIVISAIGFAKADINKASVSCPVVAG